MLTYIKTEVTRFLPELWMIISQTVTTMVWPGIWSVKSKLESLIGAGIDLWTKKVISMVWSAIYFVPNKVEFLIGAVNEISIDNVIHMVWSMIHCVIIRLVVLIVGKIQVYNCSTGQERFVNELIEQFNSKSFQIVTSVNDINSNRPLLVVCFNTSRLGTDANNAIKDISDQRLKSSVLLVVYHKETHFLPSQPSDIILVGDKFNTMYGIYEFAYITNKGIYPHDMNTQSISKLRQYIYTYVVSNIVRYIKHQ